MNIEEILTNLGYSLIPDSKGYRTNALFRGGDNRTALLIYKNGNWVDFVESRRGDLKELVKLSLGLQTIDEANEWLKNKEANIEIEHKEIKLKEIKTFPIEWLKQLKPDHNYWIDRGIKKEILEEFGGGVSDLPKLKNRYVFGILNNRNELIGLQGRSLNRKMPKYKILGDKKLFHFGFNINLKDIKEKKEIIIVESVGDALSLSSAGLRNWLCLFGTSLSNEQLTTLINLSSKEFLNKIIVSTNNDGKVGNEAALKIQNRLLKFFDRRKVEVILPIEKDLNEMLQKYNIDEVRKLYKK